MRVTYTSSLKIRHAMIMWHTFALVHINKKCTQTFHACLPPRHQKSRVSEGHGSLCVSGSTFDLSKSSESNIED